MTPLDAARFAAYDLGRRRGPDVLELSLAAAIGHTLAEPVLARAAVPGFDAAAMDGWVVRGDGPWLVAGAVRMGQEPGPPLAVGSARAVTTGGALPPRATAVLRNECGRVVDGALVPRTEAPLGCGADIRRAGEEIRAGDDVAGSGTRVTPAVAAAAAVAGLDTLRVRQPPRVAIVVLGDEVIPAGVPAPGQVRDAFTVSLPAVLAARGAHVVSMGRAGDDREEVRAALERGDVDLIITTGGTGHGSGDHLVPAVEQVGGDIVLRGIDARPGRPTVLARVGEVPVLGLPGNPFAGIVAFVTVGLALIDGMLGARRPSTVPRTTAEPLTGAGSGIRVVAARETDEGLVAVDRQGAAMTTGLVEATTLALIGPQGVHAGERVRTIPLPW